jgi:hypothetical protein
VTSRWPTLQPYALAALVLVAGGAWFFGSAPYLGEDQRVRAWKATVTRALPDVQPQVEAETVLLGTASDRQAAVPVTSGPFILTVICAGVGQVRVRLSSTGDDTGRAVRCADEPQPVTMSVALGTQFYLSMTAETKAAVFRWRLTPAPSY